jgi:CDP-4-dehydro-6-deoxyglucose reductase
MALDIAEKIYLFWIAADGDPPYLNNLCRAWNDALDNFEYVPLGTESIEHLEDAIMQRLNADDPARFDYYLCGSDGLRGAMQQFLEQREVPANQFLNEPI